MVEGRVRLDKFLVEKGMVRSRERARDLIGAGRVKVDGEVVTKAGRAISPSCDVAVEGDDLRWVSKGGLKLERAMQEWDIQPQGWICLDVGASTGGFTDVLLALGAEKVYAIDVGHDQLDEKLRRDERVVNIEKINARKVDKGLIGEAIDFICIDVSFISLTLIIPQVIRFLKADGEMVVLVKPQFEVGPEGVGKGGIVRDGRQRDEAIEKVRACCMGLQLAEIGIVSAPVLDKDKNREFLMYLNLGVY